MSFRPYQQQALGAIADHLTEGVSRQLVVSPTGTGKMVIAAAIPDVIGLRQSGKQLLFLAHRKELLDQAVEKFLKYNPGLRVEQEKAGKHSCPDTDIVCASVQTIGRKGSPRLLKFDPDRFAGVIVDEIHHGTSTSYLTVLEHFRVLKGHQNADRSKLLIGFTATPNRSDKIGLEKILDKIVFQMSIRDAIEQGWLVDIEAYRIWTDQDISQVETRAGDFAVDQLRDRIDTPARNALVVRKYMDLGKFMPGVVFSVDVAHSHNLAAAFQARGIPARAVSGETPEAERQQLIEDYGSGRVPVLISCGVLSEGWDAPIATVALMARPTKSQLLYTQQIGRVLRPHPAPEDTRVGVKRKGAAVVIDFVDNSGRHQLITTPTLFGLRPEFNMNGRRMVSAVKEIEELEAKSRLSLRGETNMEEIRHRVERVNLLAPPQIPQEIRGISRYTWLRFGSGYRLSLDTGLALLIEHNQLHQFEVVESKMGTRKVRYICTSLNAAITQADTLVPAGHKRQNILADARWRSDPPTEKQATALFRLDRSLRQTFSCGKEFFAHINERYSQGDSSYSKGEISKRIDSLTPTNPPFWKKRLQRA